MNEGQLLLLWPGEVRRKREDDSGRTGPALFASSNNQSWVIFTSREAARSREGVVLPGEEEDVCLKKGSFASWCMVAALFGLLWLL